MAAYIGSYINKNAIEWEGFTNALAKKRLVISVQYKRYSNWLFQRRKAKKE